MDDFNQNIFNESNAQIYVSIYLHTKYYELLQLLKISSYLCTNNIMQAIELLLFLTVLKPDLIFGLRYNFGDGSYFIGSVDYQGRPSGQGQYHNPTGQLGNVTLHSYHK